MVKRGDKGFGREEFAHTPKHHSRMNGEYRRMRILSVLAGSDMALSVRDIIRRTGLPRRTVYYYLRQLLVWGYVRRRGKPHSIGVVYEATRRGRLYVEEWRSANTRWRYRSVVRERRGGGGGGGVRGFWVVVGDNELGFRTGFGWVRRVLVGFGVGVGRLRFHHIYSRRGVVHFDSRQPWGTLGSARELGLYGDRDGILAIFVITLAMLKGMGYTRRFVLEAWERVPRLVEVEPPG